jgi:hypothetical protein
MDGTETSGVGVSSDENGGVVEKRKRRIREVIEGI